MANDTPALDPLQVKIALLRAGVSLHGWCRARGIAQPTAWRGLHGVHLGPRSMEARRLLAEFAAQHKGA